MAIHETKYKDTTPLGQEYEASIFSVDTKKDLLEFLQKYVGKYHHTVGLEIGEFTVIISEKNSSYTFYGYDNNNEYEEIKYKSLKEGIENYKPSNINISANITNIKMYSQITI